MTPRWTTLLAIALAVGGPVLAGVPVASTQERADDRASDLLIRIKGPLAIEAGDTVGSAWVFGNDARVTGAVRDRLFVVNGSARIEGSVRGVTIMNGHLELGPTAQVAEDVLLYRSTLSRSPDATVGGGIHEEPGASFSASALWILWVSVTLALVVVALIFARLATAALDDAARMPTSSPGGTVLMATILVVGLPGAAVLAFMSGLGFVLGFLILLVVVPALTFVGYFVSALALGRAALGVPERRAPSIYTNIATGVLVLQLLALIPVVGAVIAVLAGQLGAGAFAYRIWRQQRRDMTLPAPVAVPA